MGRALSQEVDLKNNVKECRIAGLEPVFNLRKVIFYYIFNRTNEWEKRNFVKFMIGLILFLLIMVWKNS